jgi:hypothetical protein
MDFITEATAAHRRSPVLRQYMSYSPHAGQPVADEVLMPMERRYPFHDRRRLSGLDCVRNLYIA